MSGDPKTVIFNISLKKLSFIYTKAFLNLKEVTIGLVLPFLTFQLIDILFEVVKEPPYQVSESGYASFELPVEVYFKNKEEPKKICFDYDLYLRLDDAVSHSRREKLTFQNPSNDFKKKLLKAGGVTILSFTLLSYFKTISLLTLNSQLSF